jgi:UDP-N-acetylmuramate dehydrogenase
VSDAKPWPCAAVANAPLAPRTTVRVGGAAEWLLEPATPDELAEAWRAARERGHRPRILGGGANLLVPDGVVPGVVLTTERMARVFRPGRLDAGDQYAPGDASPGAAIERERGAPTELVAWAGMPLPGLVRTSRELGWTGLEGLAGIPGHLGGGVAMNAGGRWGDLWDVVANVRVLTAEGTLEDRARADCSPRYRDGNLSGAVVLGAVLRLEVGDPAAIRERIRGYLTEKSATQPVTERSSGCIFKNPDPERSGGRSAGRLVDDCGGKGLARGDALVSPKHGNFIVNRGRARAADVLGLIEDVRRLVADRTGVELETEVEIWE